MSLRARPIVKARAGVNETIDVYVPFPVSAAPTLTVRLPSGDVAVALTIVHASTPITAYAADRRTLTVTTVTTTAQGLAGPRFGRGFVVTDAAGWFPAVLRQIASATSFVLAEPLSQSIAVGTGDAWHWSMYTGTLPAATITAAAITNPVPYTIAYAAAHGLDTPADVTPRFEGLLYVVRQPFATGLDEHALLVRHPNLTSGQPRRQQSWQDQIDAAEETLWRWLRRDLQDSAYPNAREDDVAGPPFLDAHAALTASMIARGDEAAALLEEAKTIYAEVMLSIPFWDLDADGVVDSGEANVDRRVGADTTRSLFDGNDTDIDLTVRPTFSWGQKH